MAAVAQARTMVDILNEPDWMNLRWEASDGKPGAVHLYLQAMDALYSVNPGLLFFIEGAFCSHCNLKGCPDQPCLPWRCPLVYLVAAYRLLNQSANEPAGQHYLLLPLV